MEAIETYEHAGVTVEIFPDEFVSEDCDPRTFAGNLGRMYIYRPGYELGDEQLDGDGLPEIECPNCKAEGEINGEDCERCDGEGRLEQPTIQEWLEANNAIAFKPLFIYEHSIMTIRGGTTVWIEDREVEPKDTDPRGRVLGDDAGWDTSFSGFLLVSEDTIPEECGELKDYSRPQLEQILDNEIEQYAFFLEGQVYFYRVAHNTPFEDTCGGYLGMDFCKQSANEAATHAAEAIAKEKDERQEWAARDVATEESR